ncbi:unnamed protein product [Symbiodinium necroappetens]|uniref:Uncharacterized protein n=1 Tax=Symbiodinium necroappetens TaxID=1628268 RepID=A0A813AEX1_9DINO|nr:unnamed protein product [Symbiodinium necroappetens]
MRELKWHTGGLPGLKVDIIKSRAKCWKALGCFSELKEDASKVLKLTGNRDSDALQWHRAADEGLQHKSRSRDREVLQPREASGMEAGCVLC